MSTQFAKLFSPMKIGRQEIKNRIVFQAHRTRFNFGSDDDSGQRYIAYQERRARGGAGLIVLEDIFPHLSCDNLDTGLASPAVLTEKYRRMSGAVHKHGAKIISQVLHLGRENDVQGRLPAWAFSPLPSFLNGAIPHEMSIGEIHEVIDSFVDRAKEMKTGGLDGVEIHATHASLVQQAYSPFCNVRQDEYGGDFQRRMKFPLEVVEALRDAVGPDLILGLRVSGDDWVEGGVNTEGIIEVCRVLLGTGRIDYINVSAGFKKYHYAVSIGSHYVPPGALVPYAAALKEAFPGVPVWTTDRIKDPAEAEAILEKGQADLIGMTRALIADPDLPRKAEAGDLESIRECTSCRQCFERIMVMRPVRCSQNPEAGWEYQGSFGPATSKKRVLVVGGGPAGLEAARVAAERGHEVVLCEASDDIGGQIRLAAKAPNREEFEAIIRYRRHELNRLGVDIRLNTRVDAELARSLRPDAIVLASGALPFKPPIPGADQAHVLNSWDVLSGTRPVGERVVIIDLQGEHESVSVADYLLEHGRQVEIVTPFYTVAQFIEGTQQPFSKERLSSRGARFTPYATVTAIGKDSLEVKHTERASEHWTISGIDTVVIVGGYRANDSLRYSLAGVAPELHFCGDCSAPRRVLQAVADGYRVGAML